MSSIRACADPGRRRCGRQVELLGVAAAILLSAHCAPAVRTPVELADFASIVAPPGGGTPFVSASENWLLRGKIECRLDGRRGKGRIRVILVTPHRLRADIEFSGFFGLLGARSVLWAGEDGLIWQDGTDPPFPIDGDAIFSPVLGEDAQVDDLEGLLFGLPVLWERWAGGAKVEREGLGYVLTAHLADGTREVARIAGSPPVVRRLERRDPEGRLIMEARFERHQLVHGVWVPGRLDVRAPARRNRLRIEWKDVVADWPEAPSALAWPE